MAVGSLAKWESFFEDAQDDEVYDSSGIDKYWSNINVMSTFNSENIGLC